MKKLKFILIPIILAISALLLMACGGPALARPAQLRVNAGNTAVTWTIVPGATGYRVEIDGDAKDDVIANSYDITGLSEGNHSIRVRALGDHVSFSNSDWSDPCGFEVFYESGLTYRLTNGNTEYMLTSIGSHGKDVKVDATYRGKPVTTIAESAFYNNQKITSIEIPEGITTIGDRAFMNCISLTSVSLPSTLTSIGRYAFQSCRFESIEIPSGVKDIKDMTFGYCRALKNVTLNSGLENIAASAFLGCMELESIDIPVTVKTIDARAFNDCTALTTVNIGNSVEYIGTEAFMNCTSLRTLTIGSAVTDIGDNAFHGCKALKTVNIPQSVGIIGEGAFMDCESLENVTIGSGVNFIYRDAFYNTKIWNDVVESGGNVVYVDKWIVGCVHFEAESIDIRPDTVGIAQYSFYIKPHTERVPGEPDENGEPTMQEVQVENKLKSITIPSSVVYINDRAFRWCVNLESVVIGNGVKSLGEYAFANCKNLTSFKLGNSVESIGAYCFYNSSRLGEAVGSQLFNMNIPESLTSIGTYAFYGTYVWESTLDNENAVYVGNWLVGTKNKEFADSIIVRENTIGIADFSFYGCTAIPAVSVASSVKYLGRAAFYGCEALVDVSLPYSITELPDYSFYGCTALKNVTLGKAVTSIGRSAFYKCEALVSLKFIDAAGTVSDFVLGDGLNFVGDYAFRGCTSLKSLTVLKGMTHLGARAFYGCTGLTDLSIDGNDLTLSDYAFSGCTSLQSLTVGGGVTEVGKAAFSGCTALTSVTLMSGVLRVGDYAFRNCSVLTDLDLGDTLSSIGMSAFYACGALMRLNFPLSLVTIGNNAFFNCISLDSIILTSEIENIGAHAFYGCVDLTIYSECDGLQQGWNARFDSGYRPIIWGCTLSDDKTYVVSFVKAENTIYYLNSRNVINPPHRDEYEFLGWAFAKGATEADITCDDIENIKDGYELYAVWELWQ